MSSLMAIEAAMAGKKTIERVESAIHLLRGQRVMLDSDLATIDGVTTRRLNEQLRRNRRRFPDDFAFQLTARELTNLMSQSATSSLHGGRRKLPWVFTEHGAIMLASVLNSHDEEIAHLFTAIHQLLEPVARKKTREIGFQVRDRFARYGNKTRTKP